LLRHGLAPASLSRRALAGAELLLYRRIELGDYPGSRKDLRHYLTPEAAHTARPERTLELWRKLAASHGNYDRGALLRADLWTYLSENCLTKTDRASMAHGLEVRVPLLANALQDRMLRLPASVHFDAGGGKALLRALARRHLPEAVWNREKHGFSVPLRANFAGPWREWCDAQVAAAKMRAPWLGADAIAALGNEVRQGRGNVRLFYTFAVLLAWLETHALEA
jgi:asparagine synthase (glutamine-hydrolysing)